MRIEVYKSNAIPQYVFSNVSELLHDAFAERREQGINFQCGLFTPADVEAEFVNGGYLLLAVDDNNKTIGTVSLLNHSKGNFRYLSHDNLAVSSNSKGKGVASRLFQEVLTVAKKDGYDFITSFTATTAVSSIGYHLKQGFVIYEKSFGKDYNSYSFIYPLKKMGFMRCKLLSWIVYMLLTVKNRIRK